MHEHYAQALRTAAQKDGADAHAIVEHLVRSLTSQGRIKLLPAIMQALKRSEAREAKLAPIIEISAERERAAALKAAASHGIDAQQVRVRPDLIRGWRASAHGTLLDATAKRDLVELYRKVTTP